MIKMINKKTGGITWWSEATYDRNKNMADNMWVKAVPNSAVKEPPVAIMQFIQEGEKPKKKEVAIVEPVIPEVIEKELVEKKAKKKTTRKKTSRKTTKKKKDDNKK